MAVFKFKALDKITGKVTEGVLKASLEEDAATILTSRGSSVLYLKQLKKKFSFSAKSKKISLIEKTNFCRYLATILAAGIPLSGTISLLASETENKKMREILEQVVFNLEKGRTLSATLAMYPDIFDEVFVSIVKSGEESGTLEKSFSYLTKQLKTAYQLNQKIKGALMYPAVIISTMITVGLMQFLFIIPKIAAVFMRMKVDIPAPTRILFNSSLFFVKYWWLVGLSVIVLLFIFIFLFKNRQFKRLMTNIIIHLPVLNKLFEQLDISRFTRTLGTLLKSGVPIVQSLQVASNVLVREDPIGLSQYLEKEIIKGKSLSAVLSQKKRLFPSIVTRMIAAGEKSGQLEEMLFDLAEFYEEEVENTLQVFINVLEPILMVGIGLVVGGMVISILGPIYGLLGGLKVGK